MYIPAKFPINTSRPKPVKQDEVKLEKSENNPDSAKKALNSHEHLYSIGKHFKRKGEERRKRKIKTLLDTRLGKDRRVGEEKPLIDVET